MPFLDLLVVAGLFASLLTGVLTWRRSPIAVSAVGLATLALLVAALLREGLRWQVLVMAIAAVLVGSIVLWARSGRRRGWARTSSAVVAIGLVGVGVGGAAWALPPVFVPPPGGPYAVGASSTIWTDVTRDERGGTGGAGHRSIPRPSGTRRRRPEPRQAICPMQTRPSSWPGRSPPSTACRRSCSTGSSMHAGTRPGARPRHPDPSRSSSLLLARRARAGSCVRGPRSWRAVGPS